MSIECTISSVGSDPIYSADVRAPRAYYLRAMAVLGPGSHRSGDVADVLGTLVSTVAPQRASLIKKGMIYSPAHGDTAFTVPLFDQFMKRIMPNLDG